MPGHLALLLHAHLPFVRHPEHETFLEENWLFEAITETYIPLLRTFEGWQRDGVAARLTVTLSPTLCAMFQDALLQSRYRRHLAQLLELADKEIHRTLWEKPLHDLAQFYYERLLATRDYYERTAGDLVGAFRRFQELGLLELGTTAATHAVLPLLAGHPPSVRAQVFVARDHHRNCFGSAPSGIWLPECAYSPGLENILNEAGLRWFVTDTHGLLHATPRPRYGMFAPIFTPAGVAAFGRDTDSARQVWSRHEGYPGDPRYRDFYRDIGFDLDLDYLKPYLASGEKRSFTGFKYYRITGGSAKAVYERQAALQAAGCHAAHFHAERARQLQRLAEFFDRPALVLAPYDAELFGHWWYEGPEFLDLLVRKAACDQQGFSLVTPGDYLKLHPTNQVATPAPSSWGEEGHWRVWLNQSNEWIYPHLGVAQERMTELARCFPGPSSLEERALRQAARELLLAQASDWPFILKTGTSPDYARKRVTEHLLRFTRIYGELMEGRIDQAWLGEVEGRDNLFTGLNWRYWQ
jgi:1,4-alpha-glucan branching enzyme